MQFIRFEAERKNQIDNLKAEWQRSLPEEPDNVLTFDMEIWGTPIGTTLSRSYPPDFIAFLKKKRFPLRND